MFCRGDVMLTVGQTKVLQVIIDNPKGLSLTEIGERVWHHKSGRCVAKRQDHCRTAGKVVKSLIAAGLVRLRVDCIGRGNLDIRRVYIEVEPSHIQPTLERPVE